MAAPPCFPFRRPAKRRTGLSAPPVRPSIIPLSAPRRASIPILRPPGASGMIDVQNLTKYYGDYPAVRDVTFHVPKGQIVGFLGPNGAGKSTSMRVLAGYLTATSGSATLD